MNEIIEIRNLVDNVNLTEATKSDFILLIQKISSKCSGKVDVQISPLPGSFTLPDKATLLLALKWYYNLDHNSLLRLNKQKRDIIHIPLEDPMPIPSFTEPVRPEEYWNLRRSAAILIRPIFKSRPDLQGLYGFQQESVKWLLVNKRSILADDMGLGKTVQIISTLKFLYHYGLINNCLIICPKSLISNWEDEITKWAPELTRIRFNVRGNEQEAVWKYIPKRFHITIINYEKIPELIKYGVHGNYAAIVCDEVHRVRNLSASVTKNIMKLSSEYFYGLSGTPLERDKKDLVTLLSIVDPKRFAASDNKEPIHILKSRAASYILRRKKSEVLKDLPSVLDVHEVLDLTVEQRREYDKIVSQFKKGCSDIKYYVALVNQMLTICNYDVLTKKSSKITRAIELIDNIIKNGEKVIVFSYYNEPLSILKEQYESLGGHTGSILFTGKLSTTERSKKIKQFKEIDNIRILFASARIAGEGLTLTEANNVIFLNEWWNPSSNMQAQDRVIRIGQKKNVTVYRFTCKNTIEENLKDILVEKGKTFEDLINAMAADV